jgi:hypothetical protein
MRSEVAEVTPDEIRARLDRVYTDHDWPSEPFYDALRAVLDLCDRADNDPGGIPWIKSEYIRRAIASSLGVTDV